MRRHSTINPILPLLTMVFAASSVRAQGDWERVRASYQVLEWVGGLNGESDNNGNEWNNADGKPAKEAELSEPHSAMADAEGNIYIADKNAHAIRKIDVNGIITTVAGTNVQGIDGDGPATQRRLNGPQNAWIMREGGVFYVLDSGNRRVTRVDASGNMVTVITDSAQLSRGLWVSPDESLIYYCTATQLKRWRPSMGNTAGVVVASGFSDCGNIDVAPDGSIYVSDRGSSRVYRVDPNGTGAEPLVPVAGNGSDKSSGPKDSGKPALTVGMEEARGVAFHPEGGYFVATHRGGDIWYVDTAGNAHMFIEGDDKKIFYPEPMPLPNDKKLISEPRSVTVAPNGDVIICGNDAGFIRRAKYNPPAPPAGSPAILAVEGTPQTGLLLRWRASSTRLNFQVEASADPTAANWEILHTAAQPSVEMQWMVPPAAAGEPRKFFRIREIPAP